MGSFTRMIAEKTILLYIIGCENRPARYYFVQDLSVELSVLKSNTRVYMLSNTNKPGIDTRSKSYLKLYDVQK